MVVGSGVPKFAITLSPRKRAAMLKYTIRHALMEPAQQGDHSGVRPSQRLVKPVCNILTIKEGKPSWTRALAEFRAAAFGLRRPKGYRLWQASVPPLARNFVRPVDRKSTRLNSSHRTISYA